MSYFRLLILLEQRGQERTEAGGGRAAGAAEVEEVVIGESTSEAEVEAIIVISSQERNPKE